MNTDFRYFLNNQEISISLGDYRSGSKVIALETDDYIYVASRVPFNNLYFDVKVFNDVAATPTVQIWWANGWHSAVDVIDETLGLFSSGRIQWEPSDTKSWDFVQRSQDLTGIDVTGIYNYYWLRISWSANLKATTELNYIGQKLAEEADLFAFYPDLRNATLQSRFKTGKTTWDEQLYDATTSIVADLIAKRIVWNAGQIIDASRLKIACAHKAAEIIYGAFGSSWVEAREAAAQNFRKSISAGVFAVDKVGSGSVNNNSPRDHSTYMGRG